jgi:hypothetical protein
MATLRSLLDKYDQVTQTQIDSGEVVPTAWIGTVVSLHRFCGESHGCCDAFNSNYVEQWCVPAGTSKVAFHAWGAGGGGAGACCCQQGVPSGAGAYAKKTISVSPGDCYTLCAGAHTCCCSSCEGPRGCQSFVLGNGLSNFCAEGGYGGKTCCFFYYQICCPGNYLYLGTENNCALYFDADTGAVGVPGFAYTECYCQAFSYWKQAVPYPGGIWTDQAGHVHHAVQCGDGNNTNGARTCRTYMIGGRTDYSRPPGMGAMSAMTCGGCCQCGYPGGVGLIKIDYK